MPIVASNGLLTNIVEFAADGACSLLQKQRIYIHDFIFSFKLHTPIKLYALFSFLTRKISNKCLFFCINILTSNR